MIYPKDQIHYSFRGLKSVTFKEIFDAIKYGAIIGLFVGIVFTTLGSSAYRNFDDHVSVSFTILLYIFLGGICGVINIISIVLEKFIISDEVNIKVISK